MSSRIALAIAALACALSCCAPRKASPAKPLVWAMLHPVETPWLPVAGTAWELHFAARVNFDAARDRPPTRTFPCIELDVRVKATGAPAGGGGVACDHTTSVATQAEMTLAAEALLGVPSMVWSFGDRFLVARTPRWAYAFVVMPPGSMPGFRHGSVEKKAGDLLVDGLKCDAWGDRSDCVIQEYEATLRERADVRQVLGFLSDIPDRSAVLLVDAPGASPSALAADVLARRGGPHLPLRVRPWGAFPATPTAEELWMLMDAEGKLPP